MPTFNLEPLFKHRFETQYSVNHSFIIITHACNFKISMQNNTRKQPMALNTFSPMHRVNRLWNYETGISSVLSWLKLQFFFQPHKDLFVIRVLDLSAETELKRTHDDESTKENLYKAERAACGKWHIRCFLNPPLLCLQLSSLLSFKGFKK